MDEKLRAVFTEVFPAMDAPWSDALSPDDIADWDSFGHLALIETIEREFELQLEGDDPEEMDSVGHIKALLVKRGVAA